jgi:NADH-quinone oxidoreductase subunit J
MDLGDARNWVFLAIALVMLVASFRVVTSRNVVHAALLLVVALAGSAALFLLLGAEFVAWVVVLVYIGAVVVLLLFGVMITRAPIGEMSATDHSRRWPAALIALATFAVTAGTAVAFFEDSTIDLDAPVRVRQIGDALFERWVIPFEAVSFLLLAALIGGIVLARRDPGR